MHQTGMPVLELQIEKMHCGACVRRVTQTLNGLPGTHAESVQVGAAKVTSDSDPDRILSALDAAGYPARLAGTQQ